MLNVKPENLMREIRAAEKARDKVCAESKRLLTRYMGGSDEIPTPENYPHEYVTLLMPMLVFDNPKVQVTSALPYSMDLTSKAQQHGLNRWARDIKIANRLRPVAFDMFFAFGVAKVRLVDQPGYDGTGEFIPMRPSLEHVPVRRYILDPIATNYESRRYEGELHVTDHDDLVRVAEESPEQGWLLDAIKSLKPGDGLDKARDRNPDADIDRAEIVYYELWVPEKTLDQKELPKYWTGEPPTKNRGYHGTIYTIAESGAGAVNIREPRPFFGHPSGPYALAGTHPRHDSAFPLSPLVASRQQIEDANDNANAMTRSMREYKRFFVTDREDQAEKLANVRNGQITSIPKFDKASSESVEIGGVTQQMVDQQEILRDRVDRSLSMSDAQRGMVNEDATATAESIAADRSALRFQYFKSQFLDFVTTIMEKASWYLYHTPEIVFPLGKEESDAIVDSFRVSDPQNELVMDADAGDPIELSFYGGEYPEIEGQNGSWFDLELVIEPYSMEKTNEALAQKFAIQTMELVIQLVPVIQQSVVVGMDGQPMSAVRWDELLEWVGQTVNRKNLGDFIDMDAVLAMAFQMAGVPGGVGPAPAVSPGPATNSPNQAGAQMQIGAQNAPYMGAA